MKKYVLAFILTSLLLTGCGSAAGTAESSTPATGQLSETAESKSEEMTQEAEKADSLEKLEYYNWNGIDMPIPAGMEEHVRSRKKNLRCWFGTTKEEKVYYMFSSDYYTAGETVDQLPERLLNRMDDHFYAVFESNTLNDFSKVKIDESSEEEFLGFQTLAAKGTASLNDGTTVNFIAHYAYLDFSESGDTHAPSFWMSFTSSDSKDALDRMEKAAALPLTQAKLRSTD